MENLSSNPKDINSLWLYIFQLLSLSSFTQIHHFMNFQLHPSEDIQSVLRDFIVGYFNQEWNTEFRFPNYLIEQKVKVTFHEVIELLKEKDYFSDIVEWGNTTHNVYEDDQIQSITSLGHLFRHYIMQVVGESEIDLETVLPANALDDLKNDWQSMLDNPGIILPKFGSLQLEPTDQHMLLKILFKRTHEKLQVKQYIENVKSGELNWDKATLFGTLLYGWLSVEANFRIHRQLWQDLNVQLSAHVLQQVMMFIADHEHEYHDLTLPIPQFQSHYE
ncbi:hypothetical protein G4Y79_04200 [Phototrophicus methaneseepsis]|uniref:Uncharacterized protein n=1 Tax=Phototrophicus methaneseepsis TaxID=2710758 RepID=A0A7S8IFH2_9CHLR|nr:hypothetical protein [Phototrophicus methaneseepsis]QPC83592.1 hypothetical protein G4Y79_04200 [Phototrophicus methaneseepsis]